MALYTVRETSNVALCACSLCGDVGLRGCAQNSKTLISPEKSVRLRCGNIRQEGATSLPRPRASPDRPQNYLVDGAWWFALARARRDEMEQHAVQVQAETYVDQDGVEKLRRVRFDSRQIDITENIDQWHGVDYRYFKVRGSDGNLYILRHNEIRADWELKMYEQLSHRAIR